MSSNIIGDEIGFFCNEIGLFGNEMAHLSRDEAFSRLSIALFLNR